MQQKFGSIACTTQLIADVSKALDDSEEIEACLLDFLNAFDKVSHDKLIGKLYGYELPIQVYSWLRSFLAGRTQQVVVEGKKSEEITVNSVVPQGSVVGPCLFLYYT